MDLTITTIYCICEEFLKALSHRDDSQARLSTAEVMTIPLVAAAFFGGNIEKSRSFLNEYGYMKKMTSKSRPNRRLHAIAPSHWETLFALLAEVFKELGLYMPEGSSIHADKGYTDYSYEELLEEVGVNLISQSKKNSKRPHPACTEFLAKPTRQYIETVFSKLSALFSRKIHAVRPRGFELKIVCFLLAFSFGLLHPMPVGGNSGYIAFLMSTSWISTVTLEPGDILLKAARTKTFSIRSRRAFPSVWPLKSPTRPDRQKSIMRSFGVQGKTRTLGLRKRAQKQQGGLP